MIQVKFETADGEIVVASAVEGETAMRAAVAVNVQGIDADCGGACSCATCHVEVAEAWAERVGPASGIETDMLAFEDDVTPRSRLSCQIKLTAALDGLELKVMRRG